MPNLIEISRALSAPVEKVWQALVDPAQVGTWFAARADIVPVRGGAYELFWLPESPEHQSTIGCRITAIAPAATWHLPGEGQTN